MLIFGGMHRARWIGYFFVLTVMVFLVAIPGRAVASECRFLVADEWADGPARDFASKPEVREFLSRARQSGWIRDLDLEVELSASELSPEAINRIRDHATAVVTVREYLRNLQEFDARFRLGFDLYHEAWPALKLLVPKLHTGLEIYSMFGVDSARSDHSELISSRLFNAGERIIFFVPRSVFTHSQRNATARELEWFLADSKRMKNVVFVFGAYDLLTDAGYWNLGSTFHDRYPDYIDRRTEVVAALLSRLK